MTAPTPAPSEPAAGPLPWLVRGDLDGFFGLALDNLVQLLLIDALCRLVLGFPAALVHGTIPPSAHGDRLPGADRVRWRGHALAVPPSRRSR